MVVDCLEDADDTLKLKTLDLLFKMTNNQNVEPIVEKLLSYLKDAPIES
jgi:AP-4 complex subunit epsilon-1